MRDYLAASVKDYERHRLTSARTATIGWGLVLVLWTVALVLLARNNVEPGYWLGAILGAIGASIKFVLAYSKWRYYEQNPHDPPTT